MTENGPRFEEQFPFTSPILTLAHLAFQLSSPSPPQPAPSIVYIKPFVPSIFSSSPAALNTNIRKSPQPPVSNSGLINYHNQQHTTTTTTTTTTTSTSTTKMCFRQEATFGCGHNFITSLPCAQAEETGRCRPGSTTIVREDKDICPVCAEAAVSTVLSIFEEESRLTS